MITNVISGLFDRIMNDIEGVDSALHHEALWLQYRGTKRARRYFSVKLYLNHNGRSKYGQRFELRRGSKILAEIRKTVNNEIRMRRALVLEWTNSRPEALMSAKVHQPPNNWRDILIRMSRTADGLEEGLVDESDDKQRLEKDFGCINWIFQDAFLLPISRERKG